MVRVEPTRFTCQKIILSITINLSEINKVTRDWTWVFFLKQLQYAYWGTIDTRLEDPTQIFTRGYKSPETPSFDAGHNHVVNRDKSSPNKSVHVAQVEEVYVAPV